MSKRKKRTFTISEAAKKKLVLKKKKNNRMHALRAFYCHE